MPLARIVTEFPEEAVELAMQLRARGFQVETISSKTISNAAAADLEVRLEECAVEDMLTHATEIAAGDEVCVFVAPGALEESARFDASFSGSFAFAGQVRREFAPVEEEEDEVVAREEPVLQEAEVPNGSLASAPVELTESLDSAVTVEAGDVNEASSAKEESVGIAETIPRIEISEPTVPAATEQTVVLEGLGAPEGIIPEAISQATHQVAGDAVVLPPPPEGSYWREAVAFRETAASANPAPRAVPNRSAVSGERAAHASPSMPQFGRTRPVGQSRSRAEADRAFWRIAVASAALATLVVLVGTVWHRARPTPANLGTSAGQQLPFREPAKKAATPVPPVVKDQAKASAPRQASTSVPSAAPVADGIKAASVVVPSGEVERLPAKAAPAPHKRAHSTDGGIIAEDTVIFYDRKPAPVTNSPQPAMKEHSDLQ